MSHSIPPSTPSGAQTARAPTQALGSAAQSTNTALLCRLACGRVRAAQRLSQPHSVPIQSLLLALRTLSARLSAFASTLWRYQLFARMPAKDATVTRRSGKRCRGGLKDITRRFLSVSTVVRLRRRRREAQEAIRPGTDSRKQKEEAGVQGEDRRTEPAPQVCRARERQIQSVMTSRMLLVDSEEKFFPRKKPGLSRSHAS